MTYAGRIGRTHQIKEGCIGDVDGQLIGILCHPEQRAPANRGKPRGNLLVQFLPVKGDKQIGFVGAGKRKGIPPMGQDHGFHRSMTPQGIKYRIAEIMVGIAPLSVQQQNPMHKASSHHAP